ncbi:hypothetical protein NDU88_003742 [Pleurodeles waltl]|uniref:Uncharacterized protein n=1 Tax=Pleurodeles waltl TaxID=8319 RepID=A0AAV7W5X1_PLEWA|nr:hypothetical protein NDU88_003742 [Pleurodeles waltl]
MPDCSSHIQRLRGSELELRFHENCDISSFESRVGTCKLSESHATSLISISPKQTLTKIEQTSDMMVPVRGFVAFLVTTFSTGPGLRRYLPPAFTQWLQRNSRYGISGYEPPSPPLLRWSCSARPARDSGLSPPHPCYIRGDGARTGALYNAADVRSPRLPWAPLLFRWGTAPLSDLRHGRPLGSPAPLSLGGPTRAPRGSSSMWGHLIPPPPRFSAGSDQASLSMPRLGDCGSRGRARRHAIPQSQRCTPGLKRSGPGSAPNIPEEGSFTLR